MNKKPFLMPLPRSRGSYRGQQKRLFAFLGGFINLGDRNEAGRDFGA